MTSTCDPSGGREGRGRILPDNGPAEDRRGPRPGETPSPASASAGAGPGRNASSSRLPPLPPPLLPLLHVPTHTVSFSHFVAASRECPCPEARPILSSPFYLHPRRILSLSSPLRPSSRRGPKSGRRPRTASTRPRPRPPRLAFAGGFASLRRLRAAPRSPSRRCRRPRGSVPRAAPRFAARSAQTASSLSFPPLRCPRNSSERKAAPRKQSRAARSVPLALFPPPPPPPPTTPSPRPCRHSLSSSPPPTPRRHRSVVRPLHPVCPILLRLFPPLAPHCPCSVNSSIVFFPSFHASSRASRALPVSSHRHQLPLVCFLCFLPLSPSAPSLPRAVPRQGRAHHRRASPCPPRAPAASRSHSNPSALHSHRSCFHHTVPPPTGSNRTALRHAPASLSPPRPTLPPLFPSPPSSPRLRRSPLSPPPSPHRFIAIPPTPPRSRTAY